MESCLGGQAGRKPPKMPCHSGVRLCHSPILLRSQHVASQISLSLSLSFLLTDRNTANSVSPVGISPIEAWHCEVSYRRPPASVRLCTDERRAIPRPIGSLRRCHWRASLVRVLPRSTDLANRAIHRDRGESHRMVTMVTQLTVASSLPRDTLMSSTTWMARDI